MSNTVFVQHNYWLVTTADLFDVTPVLVELVNVNNGNAGSLAVSMMPLPVLIALQIATQRCNLPSPQTTRYTLW